MELPYREPVPFKSIDQMERCRSLVKEGTMSQEDFDKALNVTNVDSLPQRLTPDKLLTMSDEELAKIAEDPGHRKQERAISEQARRKAKADAGA